MNLFNGRRILVSRRADGATRVVRIVRTDFRRLVAYEADIGEIVMRAFILRRVGFIQHRQGGILLIGPAHSGDTQRLQRFMTRNGYPHRVVDTESDPDASDILARFDLRADPLPVVIAPGESVLRNPWIVEVADALGLTETIDPGVV